jgi:hypothetical protein
MVTPDNAADLLKAASFMQIDCLQKRCEKSLVESLTTDNCVQLRQLAKQHNCGDLQDKAWEMMMANFSAVANLEVFQSLDVNELVEILADDDLNETNESLVCEGAMKWIQADVAQRRHFLGNVLGCLRLPLTSGEYLVSLCRRYPFLTMDSQAEPFLTAAREYHMTPARQQDLCSVNTEQRKCSTFTDCMFFVDRIGQVSCFSLSEKKWFRLATVPNWFSDGHIALCTYGKSCVYLSDGTGYRDDMFKYNGNSNVWNRGPKLIHGRMDHEMVAVGDSIYVLGGFGGVGAQPPSHVTSIEKCAVEEGGFVRIGELLMGVHRFSAAVTGEKIYVFGGDKNETVVQCFDTIRNTTCIYHLQSPLKKRKFNKSVGCNERIQIIDEKCSILELSRSPEDDDKPVVHEVARIQSSTHDCITVYNAVQGGNNQIIVLAIVHDEKTCRTQNSNRIMWVDSKTGKVQSSESVPFPVFDGRAIRTTVRRAHLSKLL